MLQKIEENEEVVDNPFEVVQDFIMTITENPDIVKFKHVTEIF